MYLGGGEGERGRESPRKRNIRATKYTDDIIDEKSNEERNKVLEKIDESNLLLILNITAHD